MSRLVPYLITPELKRIARFIGGLASEIKASVKASRPTTFRSAADLSLSLALDVVRNKAAKASAEGKRKREDENSHRSDKKKKGDSDHKKSSGFKKDNQQSGEKTRDQVSSMTNSDKTTVNHAIGDVTHAKDTTIVNLRIDKDVLQAIIDATVGKAVRKAVKKFKEPNATCSKSHLRPHFLTHEKNLVHASNAKDELRRKREEDNSQSSKKKGKLELKDNKQKSNKKPVCKTCKKCHYGKCRFESKSQSQPRACGICKSSEHKTLECKKIRDACCYNCNEKGHIKSNCPKYTKKLEELKKTNARVFQMGAKEPYKMTML
ncbi:uncharacterized protein LOC110913281 [Helianthus annuus]|uniref:uncharacterized protein LOC110913281 n=1 Tax=Helianthus annuus TaxID=4232 RepID=UPI000B8F7A3A|nr:uncharacterized protein LOC110913281 [Helianthus annuus]